MNLKIAYWIHNKLGDDFGGNPSPPGSAQRLEFGELDNNKPMYVATTYNNDGHEIWLAWNGGAWITFFNQQTARQLAWFILWDWWAKGTWFGLKRKIWFMALSAIVKTYNGTTPRALDAACTCGSPAFYTDKVLGVVCCRCQAPRQ